MNSSGNLWVVLRIQQYVTLPDTNPLFMGFSSYTNALKEIIFTIQSVLWRFRKVYYTSEFRFRGVFLDCELWYYYNIMKNIILDRCLYDNCKHKEWYNYKSCIQRRIEKYNNNFFYKVGRYDWRSIYD